MANWSSSAQSGNNYNIAQLTTELEDELCVYTETQTELTVINTTSTTLADMTSRSVTVVDDEKILVIATVSLSHSNANVTSAIILDADGAGISLLNRFTSIVASTGGLTDSLTLFAVWAPASSGTSTLKLQWKTDSGTLYSGGRNFSLMRFKKRN